MKICSKCGELKDLSEFYKNRSNKDGYRAACKDCCRTKHEVALKMYCHQRFLSKKRGHGMPDYSLKELEDWLLNDVNFNDIYDKWVQSNYNRWEKPSCDRIDDYKGYSFGNIKVTTWRLNNSRSHKDMKSGLNSKQSKTIGQFNLSGCLIKTHKTTKLAGSCVGVSGKCISDACIGRQLTSGGYKWKYI